MEQAALNEIKKNIKQAEQKLKEMKDDIEKAEKAGIDVARLRERYRELKMKIDMLKAAYGV